MLKRLFCGEIPQGYLFSNSDIKKLLIPLIAEQILVVTVGMLDSIMVSYAGESAVSGVSLVDTVMILIIQTLAALAAGGAVVAGQYIGMKKKGNACRAVNQLMIFLGLFGVAIMALLYVLRGFILGVVFGKIAPDVYTNANIYFMITSASVPPLALFCGAFSLFRAQGDSRLPLKISIVMNLINLTGNAILVYGMKMGTMGVAIPTLIARTTGAVISICCLLNAGRLLHFHRPFKFEIQPKMLYNILYIGVPNGLENSMFQFGKIVVLSLVAEFGTASIAANAIANTFAYYEILPGMALGLAMVSMISRCVGAGDFNQVRFYTKKMIKIGYAMMMCSTLLVFILMKPVIMIYNVSPEASRFAMILAFIHGAGALTTWIFSFGLPNTLRASNDVKFCMIISTASMWIFRVAGSYVLGRYCGLGVIGVWLAMQIDWVVRLLFFVKRYLGTKWQTTRLS